MVNEENNAGDTENGRVLARLDERLESVQNELGGLRKDTHRDIGQLRQDFKEFCATYAREHKDLEGRVATNTTWVARLDERLKIVGGLNAAWATIWGGVLQLLNMNK
jgi:hypothetical protein